MVGSQNLMENVQNWCESSCHEVPLECFATKARDPPRWTLNRRFGTFRTIWLHSGLLDRTSAIVRATKSRPNFSQRTHPIHPIGPEIDVLVCFVTFGCICYRLVALRNSVQNGPNLCKSLCHEVASKFFAKNAPDQPHWTLN